MGQIQSVPGVKTWNGIGTDRAGGGPSSKFYALLRDPRSFNICLGSDPLTFSVLSGDLRDTVTTEPPHSANELESSSCISWSSLENPLYCTQLKAIVE